MTTIGYITLAASALCLLGGVLMAAGIRLVRT